MAPFPQSDTINDLQAVVTGSGPSITISITNGDITSELMIENATYPAHEGEYTCVGLNSNREGESTNNATINVQVRGKHIKNYKFYYTIQVNRYLVESQWSLTSPMQGRGSSTHYVCVCVCVCLSVTILAGAAGT